MCESGHPTPRASLQGETSASTPMNRHPIAQLPVELLERILVYVPELEYKERVTSHHQSHANNSSWMGMTQVCSHWRKIILNLKEFWSFLPLELGRPPCRWLELSLALSNPTPIYIHAEKQYFTEDWYRCGLISALRESSRIREIRIDHPVNHLSQTVGPIVELLRLFCSTPAPFLEILDIDLAFYSESDMFGGNIPLRLHTLSLTRAHSISLDCSVFRAPLTSLKLMNMQLEQSYEKMLSILARFPDLLTLVLDCISFPTPVTAPSHERLSDVAFPALRCLVLVGRFHPIVKLIQHLHLPSQAAVTLCTPDHTYENVIIHTLPALKSIFSSFVRDASPTDLSFHKLTFYIRSNEEDDTTHSMSITLSEPFHPSSNGVPHSVRILLTSLFGVPPPRILCALLGAHGVRTLQVLARTVCSLSEWGAISIALPCVSHIDATGGSARGLVLALRAARFPRLETLCLHRVALDDVLSINVHRHHLTRIRPSVVRAPLIDVLQAVRSGEWIWTYLLVVRRHGSINIRIAS
ncbi:hypothetical protein BV25DRAFT_1829535 [Artomyces pyxidatus]|uniref:Uncharacterized protein n=1 Tax=Artomyces pyxidatus TaxID=48021 RepID=A0ACB8SRI8_9AGAM|nr:hypothetical protein BV25DRAFT_1829535 [Artomyces pyxidatus]